ncbi:MAG: hypothetical protein GF400_03875 [Candidatus Eisenbacteria bacterium]|nr:hypothetical protein [Candidatus Eisenbacteria bacterium]
MKTTRMTKLVAVASLVLLCGCIFTPRDPDGPPEGDVTDWETPINTSIVLRNLEAAFEGEGVQNYRDCFTDSFRFHVDPSDSLEAGQEAEQKYAYWTRDDEEHAANGIFADASEIALVFTTIQEPDEGTDDTYRIEEYVLTITFESEGPSEESTYEGRASLHMRRDATGRWAIYRWVDRRLPVDDPPTTWGVLRGQYRD